MKISVLLRVIITTTAILLLCGCGAIADEYRAFWIDAWGAGFLNQSQVDKLLGVPGDPNSKGDIRNANCNAVFVQVRRRADVCYPSGMGEPYFSLLSPSNFNALQAIINAAHDTTGGKQRIEVHCWMVAFATDGGYVYTLHDDPADPDNYWMTRDNAGAETGDKAMDPGHPKCEEYLTNVCMDLVNRFDIDGIHYDYIRFTANNQGYNPTSIARYNTRYGLTGQPAPDDEQFKQWRRDQVTAFVRKVYAKIQTSKPLVKQSGSFVTWNPSPTSSTRAGFQATRPYYDVYSDWDSWMQEGIVDMGVPMTYYDNASLPADYLRWINFEKDRKFNRHMIIGPGIYMNYLDDAIDELLMTRDPSPAGNYADGFSGYSYRSPYCTAKSPSRVFGTWDDFVPTLVSQVTPTPVSVPDMPWKSHPTKGHISGTVTYAASGAWADGATVSITGPENRTQICDGTGFYAFIDLTPGTYIVTASKTGYPTVQKTVVLSIGGAIGNMYVTNFSLGGDNPPVIINIQASNITNAAAMISWSTDQTSTTQVEYGTTTSYGSTTPLDNNYVINHAVALSGLAPNTSYHYRVRSTNSYGGSVSLDYTFTTSGTPSISNVQISGITASSATITWVTNAPADSEVNYGTTPTYGSQASNPNLSTSHTVPLGGLAPNTAYHYQCVSTNAYGVAQTGDFTFTTAPVTVETIVDNTDSGWSNTSPGSNTWSTGSSSVVPKIGTNYLYSSADGSTIESSSTRKCRWTPNLSTAGLYDVYVYYQIGANRNPAAPYTVHYNGGQVTSIQNQYSSTPNLGGWFLVGENLPFAAGTSGYVELTTLTTSSGYVSADAAKWVFKSTIDVTPPVMLSVSDETYTTSTTSLQAAWNGSDADSGIKRYEYAVGSSPGTTDIKSWTSAGTASSAAISGLSLTVGWTYYVTVRAVNGADLVSSPMSSTGVTVAYPVTNIAQARSIGNDRPICLPLLGVTAKFANKFYVEESNRAAGIRVDATTTASINQQVQVFGVMELLDGCEHGLKNCKVVLGTGGPVIKPLFTSTNALGGGAWNALTPSITGGFGLYNIGLLVRVVGKVTAVVSDGFYLNDGGKLTDETGNLGIKVWTGSANSATKDVWVGVTGIVSERTAPGKVYPVVLARDIAGI